MSQVPTVKIKSENSFTIINESDFNPSIHELCDGEKLSNVDQITVQLTTEIHPELQATIDQAKAECEKVVAENTQLKAKILETEVLVSELQATILVLQKPIESQDDSTDLFDEPAKETKKQK